jgi:hypothetical protein
MREAVGELGSPRKAREWNCALEGQTRLRGLRNGWLGESILIGLSGMSVD